MKKSMLSAALAIMLGLLGVLTLLAPNTGHAADLTTQYRVYQNDVALTEFASLQQATQYASWFHNSYVEEIDTRRWVWSNFPRYRVYQYDQSSPYWNFFTLNEAIAQAKKLDHASVRDLQGTGWVWNNYPKYRLMQDEITLENWEFNTLQEAINASKWYTHTHVIDLTTNLWVWDNIPATDKATRRAGPAQYRLYQGTYTEPKWTFAYIEDAIIQAHYWANSRVERIDNKKVVYTNYSSFKVYQDQNYVTEFINMEDAIYFAQWYTNIRIKQNGKEIWNNYPFYRVYQKDSFVSDHTQLPTALYYATHYSDASVRMYDGTSVWNNFKKLQFWGWNGSSAFDTIKKQVQNTVGLDVDSPTWFQLADAEGNIKDTSNAESVTWLKSRGHEVHPLVANQFDSTLTSNFLSNIGAQQNFINKLISRCLQLGVQGINVDFENLAGKDRAAYTAFISRLSEATRSNGLTLSIDLPRGSIRWNHLSAFDHEKLAGLVDYVITMAYDQHYSGSPTAGSVSGLQWAEEGVKEFLSYGIPREKLIMGIPYYVREWKIDGNGALVSNRALFMKDIPNLIATKKAVSTWDEQFKQYRIEYTEDGFRYALWLESEDTIKARLDIAKKYDLAGVAAWRLGYESSELWNMMLQNK